MDIFLNKIGGWAFSPPKAEKGTPDGRAKAVRSGSAANRRPPSPPPGGGTRTRQPPWAQGTRRNRSLCL